MVLLRLCLDGSFLPRDGTNWWYLNWEDETSAETSIDLTRIRVDVIPPEPKDFLHLRDSCMYNGAMSVETTFKKDDPLQREINYLRSRKQSFMSFYF